MVIAWFAVVVMIAGLLMWGFCSSDRLKEIGKILFIIGAFFTVGAAGAKTTVHIP